VGTTFTAFVDFSAAGVIAGDVLSLLDPTIDAGDYTINGVSGNTLTISPSPTLVLNNVSYSVNKQTIKVVSEVNSQDFIVVTKDVPGNETELRGLRAASSDYRVSRSGTSQYLTITNGVRIADSVYIRMLGLVNGAVRDRFYEYKEQNTIKTNSKEPASLGDVSITKVILPSVLIAEGGNISLLTSGIYTYLDGFVDGYSAETTNIIRGRRLSVYLTTESISFTGPHNNITLFGTTFSGSTQETISFTGPGLYQTSEFWKTLDGIHISLTRIDPSTGPTAAIEIKELLSATGQENAGDYAVVSDYYNGTFELVSHTNSTNPYNLTSGWYEVRYPTPLSIKFGETPDKLYIGSSFDGKNQLSGSLDGFRVLNVMAQDVRVGEELPSGAISITADAEALTEATHTPNTLLLLNFNGDTIDSSVPYDRFDKGYEVAPSVNDNFSASIKLTNKPYVLNNDVNLINNEGTVEFWVNPLDDSKDDKNFRYYFDASTDVMEEIITTNNVTLTLGQRASQVESVRLLSDVFEDGINYFNGGRLSNVDAKTVVLGIALPLQNVPVKVVYTPLSANGDRISIYKDPDGMLTFFMKASDVEHQISMNIDWQRHTWHRIMAMWRTNSADNKDRLRLFVDGVERGTIKYGTGLKYGDGYVYGQRDVGPYTGRFIVSDINMNDTFARLFVGSDVRLVSNARALIDNLRISNIERLGSIKLTGTDTFDINYIENTDLAFPVIEDGHTTKLLNFDTEDNRIEFFAALINAERGIFRWTCDVIDSFNRIKGNAFLEQLLKDLINKLKGAHTEPKISILD
jgi:hypothetical protein